MGFLSKLQTRAVILNPRKVIPIVENFLLKPAACMFLFPSNSSSKHHGSPVGLRMSHFIVSISRILLRVHQILTFTKAPSLWPENVSRHCCSLSLTGRKGVERHPRFFIKCATAWSVGAPDVTPIPIWRGPELQLGRTVLALLVPVPLQQECVRGFAASPLNA